MGTRSLDTCSSSEKCQIWTVCILSILVSCTCVVQHDVASVHDEVLNKITDDTIPQITEKELDDKLKIVVLKAIFTDAEIVQLNLMPPAHDNQNVQKSLPKNYFQSQCHWSSDDDDSFRTSKILSRLVKEKYNAQEEFHRKKQNAQREFDRKIKAVHDAFEVAFPAGCCVFQNQKVRLTPVPDNVQHLLNDQDYTLGPDIIVVLFCYIFLFYFVFCC